MEGDTSKPENEGERERESEIVELIKRILIHTMLSYTPASHASPGPTAEAEPSRLLRSSHFKVGSRSSSIEMSVLLPCLVS